MSEVAKLGIDAGPWDRPRRWLILAPHPDDFEVVAVTMRRLVDRDCELFLEVLSGGASGVEDAFATGWEAKTAAREQEQRDSCQLFGLPDTHLRFHRLSEDADGSLRDDPQNCACVMAILDRIQPEAVVLPHHNDPNADHRRTFRYFEQWRARQSQPPLALLVRDPKTVAMRLDLVTCFSAEDAEWKAGLLRCHRSQHERNLRSRGIGFDERILFTNREIGAAVGTDFAEGFELLDSPAAND